MPDAPNLRENVTFKRVPMGTGSGRRESLVVAVDSANKEKNLDELDIELPRLSRYNHEYKDLTALDPASLGNPRLNNMECGSLLL